MAQEDRELHRMLPREKFRMDWITFQPFDEYYPRLQQLREQRVNSLFKHMKELSLLSTHLIRIVGIVLALMALLAFSGADPYFQPIHMFVVAMVFLEAFVIIYFVHWQWNRFDLSFDAVVKYFSSGFVLGAVNALVYETLVANILNVGARMVALAVSTLTGQLGDSDDASPADNGNSSSISGTVHAAFDYATKVSEDPEPVSFPLWARLLEAFLNAFVVAAMVEEMTKYFSFWMVEHPDLIVADDPRRKAGEVNETAGLVSAVPTQTLQSSRSLTSGGAGITIAMVTTAMGFACCENFLYVFYYSRPTDASMEISTLISRSIFPVHTLAAAIQSIGVCRRDLEKDRSMGLGRIILPAVLLHGFFDFVLFLNLLIEQKGSEANTDFFAASHRDGSSSHHTKVPQDDPSFQDDESFQQVLPALISCVSTVTIGVVYYVIKANAQRRRLLELDQQRQQASSEYEQLQ
jgi:PrsW family intramembrane metalloprotease